MMTCSECTEQLSAYLDNMLEDNEKNEVKEHLKSCEVCAQTHEELRENAQCMSGLNVDPPEQFCKDWRTAVHEQARIRNRRWTVMRQAGLVAAALVVAFTAWRVWPQINGSNLNGSAKMEQRVMEAPQMAADQAPTESLSMAKIVPEAAPVPERASGAVADAPASPAADQSQLFVGGAPDEAQKTDTATQSPVALAVPQIPEAGDMAVTETPMSIASNDTTADSVQIPLGMISFRFTGIDLDTANFIVMDALTRVGVKVSAHEGGIDIPPMTAQDSNLLMETVRAICVEKNVSEVLIACTPNDVPPESTKVIVSVQ